MEALSFWIAMAGTVAFAVTAVLALAPRGIDLFGACVLGIITAIGGGTVRDLILGVPVFWATDLSYIWVALAASIATFSKIKSDIVSSQNGSITRINTRKPLIN